MDRLREKLQRLDGKGYKAYKVLEGRYHFEGINGFEGTNGFESFELVIDHVQGDPFAEPSRIRLRLDEGQAALPPSSYANPVRKIALEDFLCRQVNQTINQQTKGNRGSGKSGEIRIARCGQQVLVRDALIVEDGRVEARLGLALPAAGRRILAREAEAMFFQELPQIVHHALRYPQLDSAALKRHLSSVEDQHHLRAWLAREKLVAFVGDGAILPRRSGIDDRPLKQGAIPFEAPDALAQEPVLPHAGRIRGMGIPAGVILIVGGGFHGKSTLLQALQLAVYDHIPGDGRERVVCDPGAVKIRAEDGRAVNRVDISGFIDNLPLGRDTHRFSTENASGSTSQAANIMEALACGSHTLLIDEDTSATNFMIRDRRMQQLVAPEREPITPLIDRVRELYETLGVSTLLVTGGSSAYFDVADHVLMMDHYRAQDATPQARALAEPHDPPTITAPLSPDGVCRRRLSAQRLSLAPRGRPAKIQAFESGQLRLGDFRVDLGRVEQLAEPGQVLAIGHLLRGWLAQTDSDAPLLSQLQTRLQEVQTQGLDLLSPFASEPHGGLSLPRIQELYAALNRLRELRLTEN